MPSVAEIRQPPPTTMLPPAKRPKMEASTPIEVEAVAADSTSYQDVAPLPETKESERVDDLEPIPACTSTLEYRNGIFLAPMVRIGTLPTRLLSLEYGADLVWGPEIVDRAIIGSERKVNPATGVVEFLKDHKQIFSCHPMERPYLVYQLGSADPELAYQAIKTITQADDVAAVDLNCGCPKPFSTHAGMGANMLSTPILLCNTLKAMRRAAPAHVAVTCKIRLLPTQEKTIELVDKIVRTGAIECLTVHCRTKDMRPREPALLHRLREIVDHVNTVAAEMGRTVPVVCNGDVWDATTAPRIKELTGVTSTMIARGAEANPSCFRPEGNLSLPEIIAPKWVRYSIALNNPIGNTKYCMSQLALKPAEAGNAKHVSKKQLSALRMGIAQAKTQEQLAAAFGIDAEEVRAQDVEKEVLKDLREALDARIKQHATSHSGSGFDGQRLGAVIGNSSGSSGPSSGGQQAGDGHASGPDQKKATSNSPQPDWKEILAKSIGENIKDEKSILYYAFSTVEPPSSVHDAAKPHVRYVVHRGFVNEKRDGDAEGGVASQNPAFGSSPCLMTTTDVRTPKVQQLTSQSSLRSHGEDGSRGGECEIAWWIESTQMQFRISGTVHVLPTKDHPLRSLFPFERLSPPRAPDAMDSDEAFDWDGERTRIFNKLNAGLLASFCRPTPGTPHPNAAKLDSAKPKDDTSSPWPLELPQPGKEENDKQKEQLKESEKNFALVVVEPYKVDLVNLAEDTRTIYELVSGENAATGKWTSRRVVP
ncbi:Pyridoxamine 5'-phosphate oxidase, Alr4036 family, FMN-binding domain protein [Kalmanozyma brasiliensis GHG001]|uniref:tRNA dihydrouridine synthase n=1 Tax=Kalmanozyma brasiliensis (strain GHG001) TaxID=1365824 RepID=V5ET94_KALBG|nr:Pyridoxamine 5'-phosphate oxidase, Alr4036 family, FMN-binding domain protein [Kalmanozyma brasiliensis GHG001]EST05209.1 Pyridoxamine 5'-phosphate oxidase, Alr4036 family, FMN-binding domain protein [Kalmanozyma brasiliensis GHG001]